MKNSKFILFGPPGSGKGTFSSQIKKVLPSIVHISTGDIFRENLKNETPLGKKAKSYMDKGELVPDEVVIGMIRRKLKANKDARGFIFDGFPRTVDQAKALDDLLNENNTPVSGMLSLEVERQELINRLLNRGKMSGRADDQDQLVIENRINVYNEKTSPLIEYYKKQGKYYSINGMGTIEEIAGRLKRVVEKL